MRGLCVVSLTVLAACSSGESRLANPDGGVDAFAPGDAGADSGSDSRAADAGDLPDDSGAYDSGQPDAHAEIDARASDSGPLADAGVDAFGPHPSGFDPRARFGDIAAPPGAQQTVEDPFVGVRLIHRVTTAPRPLRYDVALVDPRAPAVSFTATPGNGPLDRETTSSTTRAFVTAVGAQLGINAHFFEPWPATDAYSNLLGICIADGEVVSMFEAGFRVGFAVSADGEARIVQWAAGDATGIATDPPLAIDDAIGASERIVTGGASTASWNELHPRTAIGVTADNVVVMLVVDGRQAGVSEGMSTPELAEVMIALGVIDAINLDGGGSSTMVIADPVARVVNRPVGVVLPGTERTNGSNFAVYARPYWPWP